MKGRSVHTYVGSRGQIRGIQAKKNSVSKIIL